MNLDQATPTLPVRNIPAAQSHYRDRLGFDIGWHHVEGRIGAVSHGRCAIFLQETDGPIHPVTLWIFAEDVDAAHTELEERGATIVTPIANTPWGLRQFTLRDLDGHILHFHHDL